VYLLCNSHINFIIRRLKTFSVSHPSHGNTATYFVYTSSLYCRSIHWMLQAHLPISLHKLIRRWTTGKISRVFKTTTFHQIKINSLAIFRRFTKSFLILEIIGSDLITNKIVSLWFFEFLIKQARIQILFFKQWYHF
jgi:hypothetical protein